MPRGRATSISAVDDDLINFLPPARFIFLVLSPVCWFYFFLETPYNTVTATRLLKITFVVPASPTTRKRSILSPRNLSIRQAPEYISFSSMFSLQSDHACQGTQFLVRLGRKIPDKSTAGQTQASRGASRHDRQARRQQQQNATENKRREKIKKNTR